MSDHDSEAGGDLDKELLALAGDLSDDEDDSADDMRSENGSGSGYASPPRQSIEKTTLASPLPSSLPAKPMIKPPPSRNDHDSDMDREGSPGSLGSGAMDESDAESEGAASENDEDVNDYPLEGLYRDAKERARILAMPEIQREQVIAERRHEKEQREKAETLRKAIAAADSLSLAKKRKAAAADLDESPQKSSRPKDKRAEALQDLKRSRENRDSGRRLTTGRSRRSRSQSSTPADGDADSEVEFAQDPVRPKVRDSPEATLEEIERLRLGRTRFQTYCFYPAFEALTHDAFARVQITDGNYRMGQIKGYTEGKPYLMEQPNGRPVVTDIYAQVLLGDSTRPWPLTHCSNSRFTPPEYEEWKRNMRTATKKVPTQAWAQTKCLALHTLVNHVLSDLEINEKILKQRKLAHLLASKMAGREREMPVDQHKSTQQRIAELNVKNKLENNRQIREALLAKRAKERAAARAASAKDAAERKAAEEARAAAAAAKVDDLFEGGSDISRTGTPGPGEKKEVKRGLPTFTRRKMDDEIISQMDFGIELDI